MKKLEHEQLMESLSLNEKVSDGYDEYPEEDMESMTFYETEDKQTTVIFNVKEILDDYVIENDLIKEDALVKS